MKPLLILALVGMSSLALADEAKPVSTEPVAQQYDYSMNLDIKRVINLSTIPNVCEVVPATMTYEDHQGRCIPFSTAPWARAASKADCLTLHG
ncbi:hypothetical protein PspTeo4_25280 [Pseudomonas sp. Teo4]|nr:hypothetical protein [Pseudomonas sp. Teo4]